MQTGNYCKTGLRREYLNKNVEAGIKQSDREYLSKNVEAGIKQSDRLLLKIVRFLWQQSLKLLMHQCTFDNKISHDPVCCTMDSVSTEMLSEGSGGKPVLTCAH